MVSLSLLVSLMSNADGLGFALNPARQSSRNNEQGSTRLSCGVVSHTARKRLTTKVAAGTPTKTTRRLTMPKSTRCAECNTPIKGHARRDTTKATRVVAKAVNEAKKGTHAKGK